MQISVKCTQNSIKLHNLSFDLFICLIALQKITYYVGKERYLFAVFDGHGGNQVAEFVRDNFVNELYANKNFIEENYETALIETFDKMDQLINNSKGDEELK
jgi:serine/threonine protein phosphatase PrpC